MDEGRRVDPGSQWLSADVFVEREVICIQSTQEVRSQRAWQVGVTGGVDHVGHRKVLRDIMTTNLVEENWKHSKHWLKKTDWVLENYPVSGRSSIRRILVWTPKRRVSASFAARKIVRHRHDRRKIVRHRHDRRKFVETFTIEENLSATSTIEENLSANGTIEEKLSATGTIYAQTISIQRWHLQNLPKKLKLLADNWK